MRKRTFEQRCTQLGRIAITEGQLMKQRGIHGVMPRTKIAKRILKTYEYNVFKRELDICGADKELAQTKEYTNEEWQGEKLR